MINLGHAARTDLATDLAGALAATYVVPVALAAAALLAAAFLPGAQDDRSPSVDDRPS